MTKLKKTCTYYSYYCTRVWYSETHCMFGGVETSFPIVLQLKKKYTSDFFLLFQKHINEAWCDCLETDWKMLSSKSNLITTVTHSEPTVYTYIYTYKWAFKQHHPPNHSYTLRKASELGVSISHHRICSLDLITVSVWNRVQYNLIEYTDGKFLTDRGTRHCSAVTYSVTAE